MAEIENRIAVINLGSQFAHLITSNIRSFEVRADLLPPDSPTEGLEKYKGIILSGSPSLASSDEGKFNREILNLPLPFLGFCFGHQELAKHAGGAVDHTMRQYGKATLEITRRSPIFEGIPNQSIVWMSHGDSVTSLAGAFEEIGVTTVEGAITVHHNAAIANEALRRYGFQFHPEVEHTEFGLQMLKNFVLKICQCEPDWTMQNYIDETVREIQHLVGDRSVLHLISGGVDSRVAAEFIARAIGPDKLHLLFIDNGLMRQGEIQEVRSSLEKAQISNNLHFVSASEIFLSNLTGVIEPYRKREIIGRTFIEVHDRLVSELGNEKMMIGQGTIYPDTVESGTDGSARIKLHHNRHPLVEEKRLSGELVEPLVDLYKFEVRAAGRELGIPEEWLMRHPFPGPGLAIRLLCSSGRKPTTTLNSAETFNQINQYLAPGLKALIMPIQTTGVKADLPSFESPVLIRGAASHQELTALSTILNNQVAGINRIVHDISKEPLTYMVPRFATITKHRLELLRRVDKIVMDSLKRHGQYNRVWQCPTVFVPISTNEERGEFVIIRPVLTERAMTVEAAELSPAVIDDFDEIRELPEILGLGIDKTSKPPATIEWE